MITIAISPTLGVALGLFLIVLLLATIVPYLIGMLTLVYLLKANKRPADISNRINHIRLWWFVLTRLELFVEFFKWLKNDELDNLKESGNG